MRLKNLHNLYPPGFWALIAAIILLSASIFYLANFSNLSPQIVLNDCKLNSEQVSLYIYDAGQTFDLCCDMISEFADDTPELDQIVRSIDIVLSQFVASNDLTTGYFYKLDSKTLSPDYEVYNNGDKYHISLLTDAATISDIEKQCHNSREPFWVSLHSYMTDVIYLSYIAPLYKDELCIGFAGINLDLDYLRNSCFTDNEHEYFYNMLVSGDYQVLIHPREQAGTNLTQINGGVYRELHRMMSAPEDYDSITDGFTIQPINGRTWVLAYTVLPTGQIYITSAFRAYKSKIANYLNLFITILAIGCIFLVQSSKRTGKTIFDHMSDLALKRVIGRMSAPEIIRMRATLALYFGMTVSAFANAAFAVMTLGFGTVTIIYIALLLVLLFMFVLYQQHDAGKGPLILFVTATLIAPLCIHLAFGGFASGNTGSLLLWTSMSFIIIMLMFNSQLGEYAFYLFVVLLFLDVLVEIYLLHNTDYYSIFTFVTALFLLGFANFTSMGLFMTLSEKDYNESIRLLEELRHTQSQLVQREKMVTLGQLIAGIAHEMNTPLGAIKASADVLDHSLNIVVKTLLTESKNFNDDDYDKLLTLVDEGRCAAAQMNSTAEVRRAKPQIRNFLSERGVKDAQLAADTLASLEICDMEWLHANADLFDGDISNMLRVLKRLSPIINASQTISFASDKISNIVLALRSYAHTNISDERTLFDLPRTIDTVLVLCQHQLKERIEVVRLYDENLPEVEGNPDELGQVWTNLVQNAIFAIPKTGCITIGVTQEGDYITARFTDTGSGVPSELRELIFEPFYTTKPLGEGNGLGLDICHKIVTAHNGELMLERSDETGSTFTVRLPVK